MGTDLLNSHNNPVWKSAHSVVSDSLQPHGLQPARRLCPWDFQARILEWVNISASADLPSTGMEPSSLESPALAGGFFTTSATWEAPTTTLGRFICVTFFYFTDEETTGERFPRSHSK